MYRLLRIFFENENVDQVFAIMAFTLLMMFPSSSLQLYISCHKVENEIDRGNISSYFAVILIKGKRIIGSYRANKSFGRPVPLCIQILWMSAILEFCYCNNLVHSSPESFSLSFSSSLSLISLSFTYCSSCFMSNFFQVPRSEKIPK